MSLNELPPDSELYSDQYTLNFNSNKKSSEETSDDDDEDEYDEKTLLEKNCLNTNNNEINENDIYTERKDSTDNRDIKKINMLTEE